jgi:hypothetical protein
MDVSAADRVCRLGLTAEQIETAEKFLGFEDRNELLTALEKGQQLGKLVWNKASYPDEAAESCGHLPGWPTCECTICSRYGSPCHNPASYSYTIDSGRKICDKCTRHCIV